MDEETLFAVSAFGEELAVLSRMVILALLVTFVTIRPVSAFNLLFDVAYGFVWSNDFGLVALSLIACHLIVLTAKSFLPSLEGLVGVIACF